jgi:hypothetical protein
MQRFIIHKWFKRFLLIAVILPVALLWGEIFTRILLPQNVDSQMNIFKLDDVIGFTYKPNVTTYEKGREYNALYKINSIGLRDREYGPKRSGVFRVLLLGDSFSVSHGIPIEDSLSRQLERSLQRTAGKDGLVVKIEVINAACGGYSPYNYWRAYSRWKPVLNPDIIIVVLSPDDYDSSNAYMKYIIQDGMTLGVFKEGQKPSIENNISIRKLRHWLSWNSEFYILLRNFFYYNDLIGQISIWIKAKNNKDNIQLQQYMVPQPESMKKAWAESFSYLKNLKEETVNDGIKLIILPVPLKLEIDPEYYKKTLASTSLPSQQFDINQPLKQITNFCRQEDIPLFDPRVAIRKRHSETPCYFVYDGHWIAEGIRAATDSVALQWRSLHFPPWNNASKQ